VEVCCEAFCQPLSLDHRPSRPSETARCAARPPARPVHTPSSRRRNAAARRGSRRAAAAAACVQGHGRRCARAAAAAALGQGGRRAAHVAAPAALARAAGLSLPGRPHGRHRGLHLRARGAARPAAWALAPFPRHSLRAGCAVLHTCRLALLASRLRASSPRHPRRSPSPRCARTWTRLWCWPPTACGTCCRTSWCATWSRRWGAGCSSWA
jgi:hypothetical protein